MPAAQHIALPIDLGQKARARLRIEDVAVEVAADILGRRVQLEIETNLTATVERHDPTHLGFLIADAAGPGGEDDQSGLASGRIADIDPHRRHVVLTVVPTLAHGRYRPR